MNYRAEDADARARELELARRESEDRFRVLAEATFEGIVITEAGRIIDANTVYCEMMGYELSEITGKSVVELAAPECRDLTERIIASHSDAPYEAPCIRRDGTTFLAEIRGRVMSHQGRTLRVAAMRDITRRTQMEEAIRDSEEQFRSIFEDSPIGMVITGPGLEFLRVNRAWCRMLAYTEDEMKSLNSRDVTHPDDLEKTVQLADRLFGGDLPTYRNEKRFVRKDGQTVWASVTTMLIHDHKGSRYGLGMIEDMTERRHAREALRESEHRYKTLSASTFEAVCITLGGRFLDANPTFEQMFGYSLEELAGMSAADLAAPESRDIVQDIILSNEENEYDAVCLRRDGTAFQAEIRGKPIPYHGNVARVTAIRDITPRKRTEDSLKAAIKELEAFSYSVSHDLRAPLRGMDGFSRKLLDNYSDKLDERGRHYLERIRAASQRMAQLIDDMLNLSRITRAEMRREPVDLSLLAHSIAQELRKMDPGRKVEFIIQDGLITHGDARLLRVVLENLLGNAWKFTENHEHARIELGVVHKEGKPVYFVKDDGAGFDMAYADKLFGAFQRLHSMTQFAGTGVGLATVQRIINRHGGRVWAEAAVERGATFYFTL